ncbi:MAG TPA: hypothetical protein VMS98_06050 [Thermoanaerobaculia bacterium]|nr:hypothetical protein [Thermoanaerobaculia bacterium]
MSSAAVLASEVERILGPVHEVHSAATDDAAATLLNIHEYDCVVLDIRPASAAGLKTGRTTRIASPTVIFTNRPENQVGEASAVIIESDDALTELATAIRLTLR